MSGARRGFVVGERAIGAGEPVFVVAEAGVNHNGDVRLARRLIDMAKEAGADAVKFQTFRSGSLVSRHAPKAAYQRATTGDEGTQAEMLARLELSPEQHVELRDSCVKRGLVFFSAPFDEASVDVLDALGVELFKVPSGEITNLPLLARIASKRKPVILSTGMSTLDEVATAIDTFAAAGDPPVALLHCLSAYPAPVEEMNLRAMDTLRERFACPVGLSDHTLGIAIALAAVGRGAAIIEKHLTLDKALPGPDHRASLEPDEFAELVRGIRAIEVSLGDGDKRPMPCEADVRRVARKSLVAARGLRAGEVLTQDAVAIKRPGTGIPPSALASALGRRVRRDVMVDEVLDWTILESR